MVVALLLLSSAATAQYHRYRWFIPPGYTLLSQAAADIDGDGRVWRKWLAMDAGDLQNRKPFFLTEPWKQHILMLPFTPFSTA
jgi:hypothetical protein